MSYWVHFEDRKPGCVDKLEDAAQFGKVKQSWPLPYPAEPELTKAANGCPPFCYTPEQCKGNSCCHKNYACSE